MALAVEKHEERMRQRGLAKKDLNFGNGRKMIAKDRSNTAEELLKMCTEAGAVASTTIASDSEVVVFYKDGYEQDDSFDELHIRPQKDACILIAVFRKAEAPR